MTRFDTAASRYESPAGDSYELTAKACKVTVVAGPCRCGKTNGPQIVNGMIELPQELVPSSATTTDDPASLSINSLFYRSTHD